MTALEDEEKLNGWREGERERETETRHDETAIFSE